MGDNTGMFESYQDNVAVNSLNWTTVIPIDTCKSTWYPTLQ